MASREEDDSEPDVRFENKTREDGHRSQPCEPARGGGDLRRLALQTPRPERREVWVGGWVKTSKMKTLKGGLRRATETDENDGENASESPERRRGQTKTTKMEVPGGEGDRLKRRRWRSQAARGTDWTMAKVSDDERDRTKRRRRRWRRRELTTRNMSGAYDEENETMDEGLRSSRRMAGWMDNAWG